jgi:hypothetical protein
MNSSQLDVQTLAVRIEKLEAANRRWKSAGAIALLFVLSLLLLSTRHAERVAAAARPDRIEPDVLHAHSVEAQEFLLKGEDGHVYARFSLGPAFMAKVQPPSPPSPTRRILREPTVQATLQFYNENGEVLWTAPTKPEFVTVK